MPSAGGNAACGCEPLLSMHRNPAEKDFAAGMQTEVRRLRSEPVRCCWNETASIPENSKAESHKRPSGCEWPRPAQSRPPRSGLGDRVHPQRRTELRPSPECADEDTDRRGRETFPPPAWRGERSAG